MHRADLGILAVIPTLSLFFSLSCSPVKVQPVTGSASRSGVRTWPIDTCII
ncbi:hypothetical protein LY78DRAFT_660142, partial [Colletotrichum sublineola]